jgi:predicted HTH domain antitoxin
MSIQLTIADSVLNAIRLPAEQMEQELRKELAIALYQKTLLPFEAASDLAQIEQCEFAQIVGAKEVMRRCRLTDINGNAVYTCSE